ncbi:MAG: hypothetical protein E6Q88_09740 [Lysobacteraceae bacterium]|nr:MAG: hypothetical protein E6Q88_09740 [Xanthomonadaceae bacterium]
MSIGKWTWWLLVLLPASVAHAGRASMPAELRGTWDYGPDTCHIAEDVENDTRLQIEAHAIVGYEHRDAIRSVRRISRAPSAWRIVVVSDIAPKDIQRMGDIYVLNRDRLTITDGESTKTYLRCQ